jgi:hypothetical protein
MMELVLGSHAAHDETDRREASGAVVMLSAALLSTALTHAQPKPEDLP